MTLPIPIPADFATYGSERSERQLMVQYKVCRETIARWRRELAMVIGRRTPWSPEDDAFLRANYGTMAFTELAAQLDRTVDSIKSRAKKLGLIKARPAEFVRRETQTRMAPGYSGEAAYLQGFGPIYRCHKDGTPAPIGAYWHWAGQTLTHDEMEAKARAHRERRELLAA